MKKFLHLSPIIVFIVCFIASSCKKDENAGSGQVEFKMTLADVQSSLKSASVQATAASVVVTIEDASGKVVKNSEKIDLYSMSGSYITQPISLVSGNYKLTSFLVLDASNNVLYASPVKGSAKAYLVQQPLPLAFSAQTNVTTKLVPEVLNTTESSPQNFGYTTFSFNVIKTFDFLVGAFIYNNNIKNYELTNAAISVYSDATLVCSTQLSAQTGSSNVTQYDSLGVTNKITLPESYSTYTLVISKAGFKTYTKTFTTGELKLYYRSADKGPLVVILEAEPVIESDFYIRGYFGGEYVNCTYQQNPGRCCNYYLYYSNNILRSTEFQFVGYEKATMGNNGRVIALFFEGDTGINCLNIDKMNLPYTFSYPSEYKWSEMQLYDDYYELGRYFAITRGPSLKVTIESISNDIISGKFSGEFTLNSKKMAVTNGEFRGKFIRMRMDF